MVGLVTLVLIAWVAVAVIVAVVFCRAVRLGDRRPALTPGPGRRSARAAQVDGRDAA